MAQSRKNKLDHYECDGQLSIFDYMSPAQEYYFDTGKTTYWQDSQGKPYQWWKNEAPVCSFSGHTCNKQNLWEVADTLDDLMCHHVCCRKCNTKMCGARCNGSQEPEPFMNEPVYELDIRGFMDDPYCPQCGYAFETIRTCKNFEVDCERCPECHVKVDWTLWHRINDKENN